MVTPTLYAMPNNITSFDSLIAYNFSIVGDLWGISVLVTLWIICFALLSQYAKQESFVASCVIVWIVSWLLWAARALSGGALAFTTVLLVLAAAWMFRVTGDA